MVIIVVVMPMMVEAMVREHLRTLVVAIVIAWGAFLVTSMGSLNPWAPLLCPIGKALWLLLEHLVHPFLVKLGTLVAVCLVACLMAFTDSWKVLACFHKRFPRFWALRVALGISSTRFVAMVGFRHHLAHLVHLVGRFMMPIFVVIFMMMVPVMMMLGMVTRHKLWAVVVAFSVPHRTRLVASLYLLHFWALLFCHFHHLLRIL